MDMSAKKNDCENPVVALVRSKRDHATEISDEEVREMVREAVRLAGGLSGIVKDGHSVVIKPNLVSTRSFPGTLKMMATLVTDPYKESSQVPELTNGVTTDRRITRAMVELVRERNPSGKVYVMECAGDGPTSRNFKQMGYTHENIPGVDEFVALGEDGGFRDVNSPDLVAVEPKNRQYKKLPAFLKNRYYFDRTYFEADAIISLCCVKNHMSAAVTGGVKNVGIGAKPANIYSSRGKTVSIFVIGHTWDALNHFIHDYYSARPVDFVLSDGLQGLAWGPSAHGAPSYEEARMNMRLIMASKDAIAHDTVQSWVVGVDPEKVPYLRDLAQEGFGTMDPAKITVAGNARVDEVKKAFPFAGGLIGAVAGHGARKALYDDFTPPRISIRELTIRDNRLIARAEAEPKAVKVEMHIDGRLVKSFDRDFHDMACGIGDLPDGAHTAAFYCFDRLYNCGRISMEFTK